MFFEKFIFTLRDSFGKANKNTIIYQTGKSHRRELSFFHLAHREKQQMTWKS
jgi:hypothetical protein